MQTPIFHCAHHFNSHLGLTIKYKTQETLQRNNNVKDMRFVRYMGISIRMRRFYTSFEILKGGDICLQEYLPILPEDL